MSKQATTVNKRKYDYHKELAEYKKERQKIALQLGYGYTVVDKIEEAKTEIEVDRILRDARNK